MMTLKAATYAKVLFSLGVEEESIRKAKQILEENSELVRALENPTVKKQEKETVINDIFDKSIRSFIKVLCNHQYMEGFESIFEAYEAIVSDSKNIIKAKLSYVTRPDETELEQIKVMVCSKYKKAGVILELEEDTSLIGGYILTVGDMEYDRSMKGILSELQKTLVRR